MNVNVLASLLYRIAFVAGVVLMGLAVLERIVIFSGYTFFRPWFTPGRLLEFAGFSLLLAIALLLRQIRDSKQT